MRTRKNDRWALREPQVRVQRGVMRLYAAKERAFRNFDRAIGTPKESACHTRFVNARRKYEQAKYQSQAA